MGLLHTSATPSTRKFPIHYLPSCNPYNPDTQRGLHRRSFLRSRVLVVYSSLRPSDCNRWVFTEGAD